MKNILLAVVAIFGMTFYQFDTEAGYKQIKLTEDNLLILKESFSSDSVAKVQIKAMELCATSPGKDLYLFLDTPGGSVIAGMNMINTLNSLSCKVHTITSFAASMGYQTVQHLGNRYILPHGILMSHRASLGGIKGQIPGELDNRLQLYKDLTNDIDKVTAKRVGMKLSDYKEAIHDELWLTGIDAVDKSHADHLVSIVCDKSLQVTDTKYEVTYSKCPIVKGYLNVKGLKGENVEDFYKHLEEQKKPILEL